MQARADMTFGGMIIIEGYKAKGEWGGVYVSSSYEEGCTCSLF